jgi:hypothetical protein
LAIGTTTPAESRKYWNTVSPGLRMIPLATMRGGPWFTRRHRMCSLVAELVESRANQYEIVSAPLGAPCIRMCVLSG